MTPGYHLIERQRLARHIDIMQDAYDAAQSRIEYNNRVLQMLRHYNQRRDSAAVPQENINNEYEYTTHVLHDLVAYLQDLHANDATYHVICNRITALQRTERLQQPSIPEQIRARIAALFQRTR